MADACGEAECDAEGTEICFCRGLDSDHDQSRVCDRPWAGDVGPGFTDVPDGAGTVYRLDALQCRRHAGNVSAGSSGRSHRMRIIVAPDKFKDCLSAPKVAEAIAAGLKLADPYVQLDLCPMGGGGEGAVGALVKAASGRVFHQGGGGAGPGGVLGGAVGGFG